MGKTTASKAVGFEVGKPLKVVHWTELHSSSLSETDKLITSVFEEARLLDSVLVFEGFEAFAALSGTGHGEDCGSSALVLLQINKLLKRIETFPGIVILLVNVPNAELGRGGSSANLNALKSLLTPHLHRELQRRLTFVVEFSVPKKEHREKLWKSMIPPGAPVAEGIDFQKLASKYEGFTVRVMNNAVFRAGRYIPQRMYSCVRKLYA